MRARGVVAGAVGVAAGILLQVNGAHSFELEGAWINDVSACTKVFVKSRNRIVLSKDADLYGSGFVVEKDRIRGKVATCTIRSRKQDGPVLHVMAACSTDVALQNVQFSFKMDNEGRIVRMFPGLPELDTPYARCPPAR